MRLINHLLQHIEIRLLRYGHVELRNWVWRVEYPIYRHPRAMRNIMTRYHLFQRTRRYWL